MLRHGDGIAMLLAIYTVWWAPTMVGACDRQVIADEASASSRSRLLKDVEIASTSPFIPVALRRVVYGRDKQRSASNSTSNPSLSKIVEPVVCLTIVPISTSI